MSKSWLAIPFVFTLLLAQPVAGQQPAESEESISTSEELAQQGLFKIDFRGGSVEEFIELVRGLAEKSGVEPANIVMPGPKPTFTFELPSIQVITDVRGALECLSACSTSEVDIDVSESESGSITFVRVEKFQRSISNNPDSGKTVQVFNLKQILMEMPKDDVVSAINLGLEISPGGEGTEIKLHEETGLLFAKGGTMQLLIISQIVDELSRTVTQMNATQYSPQNGTLQPTYYTIPYPNYYPLNNPGPYAPPPSLVPPNQVNPQPGPLPPPNLNQNGSPLSPPTSQTSPAPSYVDGPEDSKLPAPVQDVPPIKK